MTAKTDFKEGAWWPEPKDWPPAEDWLGFVAQHRAGKKVEPYEAKISADEMVALLMLEEVVVIGGDNQLYVVVNDVFAWACADFEPIKGHPSFDWEGDRAWWSLYELYRTKGNWGTVEWACLRRGMRPQVPVLQDMKKAGFWTPELEALPTPEEHWERKKAAEAKGE